MLLHLISGCCYIWSGDVGRYRDFEFHLDQKAVFSFRCSLSVCGDEVFPLQGSIHSCELRVSYAEKFWKMYLMIAGMCLKVTLTGIGNYQVHHMQVFVLAAGRLQCCSWWQMDC